VKPTKLIDDHPVTDDEPHMLGVWQAGYSIGILLVIAVTWSPVAAAGFNVGAPPNVQSGSESESDLRAN
jgi:hypothetical protein